MLFLTRGVGETLEIGDDIEVTVRIGNQAPQDTPVHREEIYEKIQQQQGAA